MKYTLHIYEHCPYCVKARMVFGLKNVPVTLNFILNDDVETPTRMIGAKMVPILEKPDGSSMPESMDIVSYIDETHGDAPLIQAKPVNQVLRDWLKQHSNLIYSLAMPRWVRLQPPLPEFETQGAIDYFTKKKEVSRGDSFANLFAKSDALLQELNAALPALGSMIETDSRVHSRIVTEDDIHLFASLHSLSIVKGVQYPAKLNAYRKQMSKECNVPLLDAQAL